MSKKTKTILIVLIAIIIICAVCLVLMLRKNIKIGGNDEKDNTSVVKYVIKKIENEYHLLEVTSKQIKDVHRFENVPEADGYINYLGSTANRRYFSIDKSVYYYDLKTGEENKWMDISIEFESDDGKGVNVIHAAQIYNNTLYFDFGSSGELYSLSLDAKSPSEMYNINDEMLESLKVYNLCFVNEIYFDNNKIYFQGRDESYTKTMIYIYEYDLSTKKATPLVGGDLDENFFINFLYNNGYIIYDNHSKGTTFNNSYNLYSYNIKNNEIKNIGRIKNYGIDIKKYDDNSVIYMDDDQPEYLTIYNLKTGEKRNGSPVTGISNFKFEYYSPNVLPYKNGFYSYSDYSENNNTIILGNEIINKSDVTDTFKVTLKDNTVKTVSISIFYEKD